MQKRDIITYFFEIADDMGRDQYGMVFLSGEIAEDVDDFVPCNRIESACRFVENQESGVMDIATAMPTSPHTARKILKWLVHGYIHFFQILRENFRIQFR
jgi:hypothetical protein